MGSHLAHPLLLHGFMVSSSHRVRGGVQDLHPTPYVRLVGLGALYAH